MYKSRLLLRLSLAPQSDSSNGIQTVAKLICVLKSWVLRVVAYVSHKSFGLVGVSVMALSSELF
ncbi:MAG: hypothetical protein ACKERG_02345 [Candidatus Hodgkinia cicadicola]